VELEGVHSVDNKLKIESILDAIHRHLMECPAATAVNPGLMSGEAGVLLFFWNWLKHSSPQHPRYSMTEHQFQHRLNDLLEQISHQRLAPLFGNGTAGISWLMELLLQEQSAPYSADFNEQFEQQQLQMLSQLTEWSGELELLRGLTGELVLANRRLDANPQAESTLAWIGHLLRMLRKNAVFNASSCYWPTPKTSAFFKSELPLEQVNLGLAHGMTGILASFIPLLQWPQCRTDAELLLRSGCEWLVMQQKTTGRSAFSSFYPSTEDSRLGWCYGDLTIALTLWRAGVALNNRAWCDTARAIALNAAKWNADEGWIADAGICHGSMGLVLIFRLLAAQLGDAQLHLAADRWLQWSFNRYERQGLSGLHPKQMMQDKNSFLEGFAGIGLVLMFQSGQTASWADALLLADPTIAAFPA
jgi:lantibiotic modifying enzyme